jgi:ribosomal protein L15E
MTVSFIQPVSEKCASEEEFKVEGGREEEEEEDEEDDTTYSKKKKQTKKKRTQVRAETKTQRIYKNVCARVVYLFFFF